MINKKRGKITDIANSVVLILASRAAGFVVLGLCSWILAGVAELKTGIAVMAAKMQAVEARITLLERWQEAARR